jgi:hypothetical protein
MDAGRDAGGMSALAVDGCGAGWRWCERFGGGWMPLAEFLIAFETEIN